MKKLVILSLFVIIAAIPQAGFAACQLNPDGSCAPSPYSCAGIDSTQARFHTAYDGTLVSYLSAPLGCSVKAVGVHDQNAFHLWTDTVLNITGPNGFSFVAPSQRWFTPPAPGTYSLTVTSNACGSAQDTATLVVSATPGCGYVPPTPTPTPTPAPTANLSASCTATPNPAQTNQAVTFLGQASGGTGTYSYSWSGACNGSSQNCTTSFANSNSYLAYLTVTSGNQIQSANCTLTVTGAAPAPTPTPTPTATLSAACAVNPNPAQVNQVVTFLAQASGGTGTYSYSWSGACSGSAATCATAFASPNSYLAYLTITSGNQMQSAVCPLTVGSPALSVSCAAAPNPAQTGQLVVFTSQVSGGSGNYSYSWSGACNGTGVTCTNTFSQQVSYLAKVTVTDGGVSQSASCLVDVGSGSGGSLPVARITVTPANTVVSGTPVTLDGTGSSSPNGAIAVYAWYEGNSLLDVGPRVTKALTLGTHSITLTVTDSAGRQGSAQTVIAVTPAGAAQNTVSLLVNGSHGPVAFSSPAPVTLSWNSTGATACVASGNWSGTKQPTGGEATPTLNAGTYHYALSCGGASDSVTVVVGPGNPFIGGIINFVPQPSPAPTEAITIKAQPKYAVTQCEVNKITFDVINNTSIARTVALSVNGAAAPLIGLQTTKLTLQPGARTTVAAFVDAPCANACTTSPAAGNTFTIVGTNAGNTYTANSELAYRGQGFSLSGLLGFAGLVGSWAFWILLILFLIAINVILWLRFGKRNQREIVVEGA